MNKNKGEDDENKTKCKKRKTKGYEVKGYVENVKEKEHVERTRYGRLKKEDEIN